MDFKYILIDKFNKDLIFEFFLKNSKFNLLKKFEKNNLKLY